MIYKGIIQSYDVGTHTCDVIITGGTYAVLNDVRVADNIDAADCVADNLCIIAKLSEATADMIIIAAWTP